MVSRFRFEIYQGKTYNNSLPVPVRHGAEASEVDAQVAAAQSDQPVTRLDDTMTGPAALLRNCSWMHGTHRTVFCDRFYTSVGLFVKLKDMGINAVGTIMGNRKGFSNLVKFNTHEVRTLARGTLEDDETSN